MVNVGKYSIHGAFGNDKIKKSSTKSQNRHNTLKKDMASKHFNVQVFLLAVCFRMGL